MSRWCRCRCLVRNNRQPDGRANGSTTGLSGHTLRILVNPIRSIDAAGAKRRFAARTHSERLSQFIAVAGAPAVVGSKRYGERVRTGQGPSDTTRSRMCGDKAWARPRADRRAEIERSDSASAFSRRQPPTSVTQQVQSPTSEAFGRYRSRTRCAASRTISGGSAGSADTTLASAPS